jgi:glycosidase
MRIALFPLLLFCMIRSMQAEENLFRPSPRSPRQNEVIYLLMPDRFWDGDPSNNFGGLPPGDYRKNGFNPMSRDFYHGGDLKGIEQKLDYLGNLGITSIWMTPIFRNQTVKIYDDGNARSGYHGYWILDFTDVDPHFGSKEDLQHLIGEGKKHGIGMILDIVVNHTADVIRPKKGVHEYQYKFSHPYLDADGKPFDDRDYIGQDTFPKLDPDKSFPVPPSFANETDRTLKQPDWLNDPTVYHNRGDASTSGESAQYGDIAGLDDLFTEQPKVVNGMIDIYTNWIREFDIMGFRLDTVKHVNNEFWQKFVPAMRQAAKEAGRKDFLIFGEVYDPDPAFLSEFGARASIPSVLDFGFQKIATDFATGNATPEQLAAFFAKDCYYSTSTTNAYSLVTFLGNHDLGRIGYFLERDAPPEELLERDMLAHALLFFSRGIPSIYYGDEQGFTGDGGDTAAREDMFASLVPSYMKEDRIGGSVGPAFNESSPLFQALKAMIVVRKRNAALQSGIQIVRYADKAKGLFAISRINPLEKEEILVVFNNGNETKKADIGVSSPAGNWERLYASVPKGISFGPGPENRISVELAPRSALVLRSPQPIDPANNPIGDLQLEVDPTGEIDGRWELRATISSIVSVAFGVRAKGESEYTYLGTADTMPYRIFPIKEGMPRASGLEFKAIARDLFGNERSTEVTWQARRPRK